MPKVRQTLLHSSFSKNTTMTQSHHLSLHTVDAVVIVHLAAPGLDLGHLLNVLRSQLTPIPHLSAQRTHLL